VMAQPPGFMQQQPPGGALGQVMQQQQVQPGFFQSSVSPFQPVMPQQYRPLQPPSRQPGPPVYMPQAVPHFVQQRPSVQPSFQQQHQMYSMPPFGQFSQQQQGPTDAMAADPVGPRNKRKKKGCSAGSGGATTPGYSAVGPLRAAPGCGFGECSSWVVGGSRCVSGAGCGHRRSLFV
jgi:hypothetical protein